MKKKTKKKTVVRKNTERVLFECTPAFKRKLKRAAKANATTMSKFVRDTVQQYGL